MRRFELPIACFVLAAAFLVARLYDIQVGQHEVWATEAANLVRSYHVEPYRRGSIRDREGRIVARDHEVYELEFVWRDFRRGHPLGQVAMAWSLVLGAPVGLDDARAGLRGYARSLVGLTPADIEGFARGAPLVIAGQEVAPPAEAEVAWYGDDGASPSRARAAERARRRARAGDLAYYLYRLLALRPVEERAVRSLSEDKGLQDRPLHELASIASGVGPDQVLAELDERLEESLDQLGRLAAQLSWDAIDPPDGALLGLPPGATPGARAGAWRRLEPRDKLVTLIEARREAVEDETADALFRNALGFPPWRFDEANLGRLDLAWMDRLMGWNAARRLAWVRRRGAEWPRMVDDWLAGHVIARAKLALAEGGAGGEDPADALLSAVAHAFRADADAWARRHGAPEDWRAVEALEGLATLPDVLVRGDGIPRDATRRALAFQEPRTRTSRAAPADLLDEVFGPLLADVAQVLDAEAREEAARAGRTPPPTPTAQDAAHHLVELVASRRQDWDRADARAVAVLLNGVEASFQRRVGEVLEPLAAGGPLALRPERIDRAEETRRYVVRDRGSRPKVVGREPRYDLVHLVTRHPREFAGFRVRPTTRRERPGDGVHDLNHHAPDGTPVAEHLVGKVRHPYLVDLLSQRPGEVELAEMQRKLALPDEDRDEILDLVEASWHPEERMGGSGIEGWFDRELRGKEGYTEFQGLQDRESQNRAPIHRPPVHGQDVWLTLDLELQRAVEDLLRRPTPPDDPRTDRNWFEHPVGAVVLARTDGEILVAASTPLVSGLEPALDSDEEGRLARERTLRQPRFEPPGSIIKPLLAAYALQRHAIAWEEGLAVCSRSVSPRLGVSAKAVERPGWGLIDCASLWGHSGESMHKLAMREALKVSCNTYFAALAEGRYEGESMCAALTAFGLGQPSGVRYDPAGRTGLLEDWAFTKRDTFRHGGAIEEPTTRQYVGNGLRDINVNVVQMARAYAGLASGRLPRMRLVSRVGEVELAPESEPLPIDEVHLTRIRGALRAVVAEAGGSAYHRGLEKADAALRLAGKTGSADYRMIPDGASRLASLPDVHGEPKEPGSYMRKHAWFAGWFPAEAPRFVVVVYLHDSAATSSHTATYLTGQLLLLDELCAFFAREGVL